MSVSTTEFNNDGLTLFKQLLTPRLGEDFVLIERNLVSFIEDNVPEDYINKEEGIFFGRTGFQQINGKFLLDNTLLQEIFAAIQEKIDAEAEGGEIDGGGGGE